jgi:predicted ATP-grasp superfamily ATP-dependent carboligase
VATILITDGSQRAALAIVRSLGRAGYRCLVTSETGRSLAGASRHSRREIRLPDPAASPGAFGDAVRDVVMAEGVDVVVPVSEAAILAVLASRDDIPAAIPFPGLETFRAVCDKRGVLEVARELGIRVPRQWEIESSQVVPEPDLARPLVLKPARSVYTAQDGTRGKVGVRWVRDRAGMDIALAAYPTAAFPILAQERIIGPGTGIFVLLHQGRCLARFAHRRLREKPPSGGVSVVCRSEPMDDELLEQSLELLNRYSWSGVAMVEYKRDSRSGEPFLMEINGRFWGSLQLAIDAGVDFPRLLVDAALGNLRSPVITYGEACSRWLWGDVDHLIARWQTPGATASDRARAVLSCIRAFGPGYREEVLRWRDPKPFVRETVEWVRNVTGRGRGAGGRAVGG